MIHVSDKISREWSYFRFSVFGISIPLVPYVHICCPLHGLIDKSREVSKPRDCTLSLLPMCLSNFRTIRKVQPLISRLRNFTRSCGKTPIRLVTRGPESCAYRLYSFILRVYVHCSSADFIIYVMCSPTDFMLYKILLSYGFIVTHHAMCLYSCSCNVIWCFVYHYTQCQKF